jgi:hypothetical protein
MDQLIIEGSEQGVENLRVTHFLSDDAKDRATRGRLERMI